MKFPLDNDNRKTPGAKTAAIHDRTGKILFQVLRVNLPREHGESIGQWRGREISATVERASTLVRVLNAAYAVSKDSDMVEQAEFDLGRSDMPAITEANQA